MVGTDGIFESKIMSSPEHRASSQHPYRIDLFDDEVIKTVETYSVESGLTKKECIKLESFFDKFTIILERL